MEVSVHSSASQAPPEAWTRRRVAEIARAAGSKAREISVLYCGDTRMRSLNRRFRRKDRTTDVLAFPAGQGGFLGDIAISVPYASRQASRAGLTPRREIDRLLLHGVLHLMGYDHETDRGEMDALEAKLRTRLGLRS